MMCCNNCGWLRWVTTTNTAYYCEFDGQPLSDLKDCCQAWKSTIQTNADRIRNMTDEEIADFLCDIGECDRRCPAKIGDCIFSDSTCRIAWLEWLKEEVKE